MAAAVSILTRSRRGFARRTVAAISAALVLAALLAAAAWAVTPRNGLWCKGTGCGGVGGAHSGDGNFGVQGRHISGLMVYERCLKGGVLTPGMTITRNGTFSYKGRAQRLASGLPTPVTVEVHGRFTSSTRSSITLKIHYGHCGTRHTSIPFP